MHSEVRPEVWDVELGSGILHMRVVHNYCHMVFSSVTVVGRKLNMYMGASLLLMVKNMNTLST